jgi:rubredoxin
MNSSVRYACLCCGYLTLDEKPPGTYDICPVCNWEDDYLDPSNPRDVNERLGGPNGMLTLRAARENFNRIGAASPDWLNRVRSPREDEQPRVLW